MRRKFSSIEENVEDFDDALSNESFKSIIEIVPSQIPLYYGGGGDVIIVSEATGKKYRFNRGKPTLVDKIDADYFMTLKKKAGCCGNQKTEINLFGTL